MIKPNYIGADGVERHSCFNRDKPAEYLVVQDGYAIHFSPNGNFQIPHFIKVKSPFPSNPDHPCEYTHSSPYDPKCQDCIHQSASSQAFLNLKP